MDFNWGYVFHTEEPLCVGLQISPCTRSFLEGGELPAGSKGVIPLQMGASCAGDTNWGASKALSNPLQLIQLEQGVG